MNNDNDPSSTLGSLIRIHLTLRFSSRLHGVAATILSLSWRPRRWKVDPAVDTRGEFSLDPSFEVVVLGVTHDPTTRTEPTDHNGNGTQYGDDGESGNDGSNRPVTRVRRRVGLSGLRNGRWLLWVK